MNISPPNDTFWTAWRDRLRALRSVPPAPGIVWEAGPSVVAAGVSFRILAALIPILVLAVSRKIIDGVVDVTRNHQPVSAGFWWLVALEFALVLFGGPSGAGDWLLRRPAGGPFYSTRQHPRDGTRFPSRSIRLQGSGILRQTGACPGASDRPDWNGPGGRPPPPAGSHGITLSASIFIFSPWLLLLLVISVVPAFIGESHFAFLGYALNSRLTPTRRELDYLRVLGASKESAKELRLFGLSGYFSGKYARLSDMVYSENVALLKRRLRASSVFALLSTGALLRRLRVCHFSDNFGTAFRGYPSVSCRRSERGKHQYLADLLRLLGHRRPSSLPDRPFGFLCCRAEGEILAARASRTTSAAGGIRVQKCFVFVPWDVADNIGQSEFQASARRTNRLGGRERTG